MTDEKDNEIPSEDDVLFENEEEAREEAHAHKMKRHGRKNVGHRGGNAGTWQFLTVLFAALFVLSVFTSIFDFMNPSGENDASERASQTILMLERQLNDVRETAAASEVRSIENEISTLKEIVTKNAESIETRAAQVEQNIRNIGKSTPASGTKPSVVGEQVALDFYVMSRCPYGLHVEDAIAPVLKKLGDNVDFGLYFIANDNGDGTFRSLQGEPEVLGNIVQGCAMHHEPDTYMDLIVCMNIDGRAIPGNWEQCAIDLGMDVEAIRGCYEGEEGKDLLRESIKKTNEVGATGSPTIYLNGNRYTGGRGEMDFMRALCEELQYLPEACQEIPEPAAVNIIVLNDMRCDECDLTQLMFQLESIFPGMMVTEYDYSDDEGKGLYQQTGITFLPAIFFDDTVENGEGYANVAPYLEPKGDYQSLRIGAGFNPTAEICDNGIDDTGNGMIDCDDETCKDRLICREEMDEHLQVFIMSDCPYGKIAVEALKGANDHFGGNLNFEIHYIANEAGDGFSSLHGQYEVDENIIQLCVKKHSPSVWFDYMYCRSIGQIRGVDWNDCGREVGVDLVAVQACFDGDEGADLLREDIKIANALQISASPTWLANNRYTFSGIDAETVRDNFCRYNPGFDGCDSIIVTDLPDIPEGSC